MVDNPPVPRKKGKPPKTSPKKKPEGTESPEGNCVCGVYLPDEVSIGCEGCELYWHLSCVGLKGLTEEMASVLEHWECPKCFVCPLVEPEKVADTAENRTLQLLIKEELHLINPVIRSAVRCEIKNCIPSEIYSKGDIKEMLEESNSKAVKTYAEITSSNQKKVIEELSAVQTTKEVVKEVTSQLGVESIEREKRRLNLCVMKAPESTKSVPKDRQDDDTTFCVETLGIPKEDIESCYRAGKKKEDDSTFNRPLIIKMKNQKAHTTWSDNGRGYLVTGTKYYINPDLCRADRDANFRVRKERQRRRDAWEAAAAAEKKAAGS